MIPQEYIDKAYKYECAHTERTLKRSSIPSALLKEYDALNMKYALIRAQRSYEKDLPRINAIKLACKRD